MPKKGLGKGLSALLPDQPDFEELHSGEAVRQIDIAAVHANPNQPRKNFDADKLAELTDSLRQHGILQPLIVVPDETGYLIVAGERRYRAALSAGLSELPCIVRSLTPSQLAEISLLENIQREDLSPLEEAEGFRALMENFGYTQEQLAARLGRSRPGVANTLRLLRLAPQERRLLNDGLLSAGHARAVLAIDDVRTRAEIIEAVLRDDLNVRQTEQLVNERKNPAPAPAPAHREQRRRQLIRDDVAKRFSRQLGVRARIESGADPSRGRVVLDFTSENDLQNIIDAILGPDQN